MGALGLWHVAALAVCALVPLALGAGVTLLIVHVRRPRGGSSVR